MRFVLLLLCACAAHHPPLVVVLGSSTAAGAGLADPQTSWVNRYAADIAPAHLTNLAVSGYSTDKIVASGDPAHNITAALALHPDVIIINLPSNDAAAGTPVATSLGNLAQVAQAAGAAHVAVWVTTSQPRDLPPDRMQLLVEYRDQILKIYAPRALDFYTPLAGPDGKPDPALNQGDGIHPNPEGHRRLFEVVRAANILRR